LVVGAPSDDDAPRPKLTCFPQVPGLLGTTENELGIRKWLEDQGHTLVTTSDKEGEGSTFDKELVDAEVIITTP
jgi:formate dehydrogenase